jgi:hypothetical protein
VRGTTPEQDDVAVLTVLLLVLVTLLARVLS